MRVLVTGAAGRIGSATCERLAREGFDVLGADLAFRKDGPVRTHVANLLDREACYRLLEDAEAVIHLANHPDMHGRDSQKILNENVAVNMNVRVLGEVEDGGHAGVRNSGEGAVGGNVHALEDTAQERVLVGCGE